MATDKYDLHTIDYSVQGWSAIMATDMEILDDELNTRVLATLGETVAVSDALYIHTDGKYYKAKSDGTKQPAMGLAIETGILNDSIRIQRVGPMTNAGWSWSDIGKIIFLSSTTAGDLTETEPATDAQAVGVVLSTTSIFIDIELPITVSGTGGVSNHSELNELDYASAGHTGFSSDTHTHDDRYYTESEVDTISGTLQTNIDEKAVTLLELTDTPSSYDNSKYLRSTTSGAEWATVSGADGVSNHSELNELNYASAGHTGFSPTSHSHTESDISDLDKYTQAEVDTISGSLNIKIDTKAVTLLELTDTPAAYDDNKYLRSTTSGAEWATVSGNGSNDHSELSNLAYADSGHTGFSPTSHEHVSTEITVEKLNTPTYDTLQEWIDNTQSAGRMSGGATSSHTDAITGVTVSGAGNGEFKVSGDQTAYFPAALSIYVLGSTNNDGYYTVSSGVSHAGGTTTIPVDEAVAAVADGNIYNGRVDVAVGTGFIKTTDSDIASTKSFDLNAQTNIELTTLMTNYLYVDYNAGTPDVKVTTDRDSIEYNRQFPVGMAYRNGPRTWCCSCEIYLPNRSRLDHERILILRGYERASGGEISEAGTRNIESTAGKFFRGPIEIGTTEKDSATDKMTTVYYNGSNWVWTEEETQIDNTYYNNTATGLVELTSGRYAVHWVCIDYLSNLYVVYGRGDYTLPQAELASLPSLMPVVAYEFGIVAAKIIVQKAASSFTEVISAYKQLFPSATPTNHNNLSGLNDGDYKHLTAALHTDLTDGNICTAHKHNIVEDTTPQLGGTLEINEKTLLIDATLTSDHTWTGPTQTITAGQTLTIFQTAYLKSDGKYWLADASAEATADGKIVMSTTTISGDAVGIVLLPGEFSYIRDDSTSEWTVTNAGDLMFLSTTSGTLTNDVSGYTTGDIIRLAGYMETATIFNFLADKTFIEK